MDYELSNWLLVKVLTPKLKPGLSLVELLIAMAVLGVVSIMVASVYLAHFRLFSVQNTNIDIAIQNSIALDEMASQIRETKNVVDACLKIFCEPGWTGSILTPDEPLSSERFIMKIWPLDSSGNPFEPTTNCNEDYVTYQLKTTASVYNLIKEVAHNDGCGPVSTRREHTKIIASGVTLPSPPDVLFRYFDSENQELIPGTNNLTNTATVVITLTTKGKALDRPESTYTQSRKVLLRNK